MLLLLSGILNNNLKSDATITTRANYFQLKRISSQIFNKLIQILPEIKKPTIKLF